MMGKKVARKWTAEELVKRVRAKYEGPACAVFEQVASGTGVYANSWIDVVGIDLWPSRGFTRRAFEVKVARSDFIKEIENPNKNGWCLDFFHEFWYVAPEGVIVGVNELPENTGWLCPRGGGLTIKRAASRREEPDLDESFFAALCRASQNENSRMEREFREDLVRNDPEIRSALVCMEGCEKFLREHEIRFRDLSDKDKVVATLREATVDKKARADRKQFDCVLEEFELRIEQLLVVFCEVAHLGILETDTAGRFLSNMWDRDKTEVFVKSREARRMKKESVERRALLRSFLADFVGNGGSDGEELKLTADGADGRG